MWFSKKHLHWTSKCQCQGSPRVMRWAWPPWQQSGPPWHQCSQIVRCPTHKSASGRSKTGWGRNDQNGSPKYWPWWAHNVDALYTWMQLGIGREARLGIPPFWGRSSLPERQKLWRMNKRLEVAKAGYKYQIQKKIGNRKRSEGTCWEGVTTMVKEFP